MNGYSCETRQLLPSDSGHADIIEVKLAGGAVESDAEDHFFGVGGDGDDGAGVGPVEGAAPFADLDGRDFASDVVVEVCDDRGLSGGIGSGEDGFAADPVLEVDGADGASFKCHTLEGLGDPAVAGVFEAEALFAFHDAVGADGSFALVVPAINAAVFVGVDFEGAIDEDGVIGIGEYAAEVFGGSGHGDEESGDQFFVFEFAIFLAEEMEGLLVAFAHGDDHMAAFGELFDEGFGDVFG